MKKLIIEKTLVFIFVVVFVSIFKSIFGDKNLLIGVTSVVALLMTLERNLTVNPLKNFLGLLGINVLQGIFSFIAVYNLWVGIPVNFISMFIVGFFFTYSLKKPLHIAFGLQYLFMLATPVSTKELPLRLMALATGAIIIMGVQLLINRNKLRKAGNQMLIQICDGVIEKGNEGPIEGEDVAKEKFKVHLVSFRTLIFKTREQNYYLSNLGRLQQKISGIIEQLEILLEDAINNKDEATKTYIIGGIKEVKDCLGNKKDFSFGEEIEESQSIQEAQVLFSMVKEYIHNLHSIENHELEQVERTRKVPYKFTEGYLIKSHFTRESVRFTYATRLALTIAIAAFIADFFLLSEGRWILFTVFSVIQPYAEFSHYRFKERVIGTILGATLLFVLFEIFQSTGIRTAIVLLAGYINGFATKYRYIVLTVTLSALGSAAIIGNEGVLTIERITFVIAGVILGFLANQFILPFDLEKGTRLLVRMYEDTNKKMVKQVYKYMDSPVNQHTMNALLSVGTMIEERISVNIGTLHGIDHDLEDKLEEQRRKLNGLYILFLKLQAKVTNREEVEKILKEI